ncbi:hypothetical protein IG631_21479 [Alternaria alternata]|nr:hypothetical protein IG631_21479 [Alternaria alternata]
MPVGSVDSGLGAELEDGQPNQTRSSSEEKDNLTPAQSRRKAQNRAACVLFPSHPYRRLAGKNADLRVTASAHSASAKNAMSRSSRRSSRPSSPALAPFNQTTSA